MKQALKLAIKGGFEPTPAERDCLTDVNFYHTRYKLFLDPLFWQALGKALGWADIIEEGDRYFNHSLGFKATWLYYWHLFIDHLADGKDADSYFDALLNTK